MKPSEAILVGLLVVLTLFVVCQGGGWGSRRRHHTPAHHKPAHHDNFAGSAQSPWRQGSHNPYTTLNKQLDTVRGWRHDGYNQTPLWQQPHGLDRYHRSGANLRPEDVAEAEREQWFAANDENNTGGYNTELAQDAQADAMQYHTAQPAIDYSGHITDLVIDPRTRENHQRWVEEMRPWSGTAMIVDDMDEALEASAHFTGLRRPQSVVQHNPLQLTERDSSTFASNPKFNFRG